MHSVFVLKAFLVGWEGAAARLVMFLSWQIALLKYLIKYSVSMVIYLPLFLKGPTRSWETDSTFFACEKISHIPYFPLSFALFSLHQVVGVY